LEVATSSGPVRSSHDHPLLRQTKLHETSELGRGPPCPERSQQKVRRDFFGSNPNEPRGAPLCQWGGRLLDLGGVCRRASAYYGARGLPRQKRKHCFFPQELIDNDVSRMSQSPYGRAKQPSCLLLVNQQGKEKPPVAPLSFSLPSRSLTRPRSFSLPPRPRLFHPPSCSPFSASARSPACPSASPASQSTRS
jgi:hypothetical protein